MSDIIQIRRDTAANWSSVNPVLANGEMGLETDTIKIKWGNGVSAWNALAYFTAAGGGGSVLKGTAVIDFGAYPGKNYVSTTVANVNIVAASSQVLVGMGGTATATHSIDEHAIVPMQLTVSNLVNATSFDILAVSDWKLSGTFNVFYLII